MSWLFRTLTPSDAAAMSGVDGALHVDRNCMLRSFACLLDGMKVENENLDRGARHNSALRFARQNPKVLVLVVSEDGHQTIFNNNGEVKVGAELKTLSFVEKSELIEIKRD